MRISHDVRCGVALDDLSVADLRAFAVTVEAGSISSAAELLGYSQSALSRRIAALERMVGVPLFTRLPRGVALTGGGTRLLDHTTRLLDGVQAAQRDLAASNRPVRRLRVGSFSTANATLVPTALRRLTLLAGDITVSVREDLSPALLRSLARGAIDVAVVSDYEGTIEPPDTVRVEHLLDDQLAVALPSSHPLAGEPNLRLADLADESWVVGVHAASPLTEPAKRAGFTPRVAHRVGDWSTKLGFVAAGLGLTVLPMLGTEGLRTDVVVRPLPHDLPRRSVHVATIAADEPTPAITSFIEMIVLVARERSVVGHATMRRVRD